MGFDYQKPSPEHLAKYLNFLVRFARRPSKALQPYAGKGSIASELLYFVAIGVVFSVSLSLIASNIGTVEDPSETLAFVRSFNTSVLPLVAIVMIFVVTLAFHLVAKALIATHRLTQKWATVSPGKWDPYLGGSIEDSVNGSFGFAAFFIPLVTFTLSVALIIAKWNPGIGKLAGGIGAILLGIVATIYFPSALAATHPNTSFGQSFTALAGSVVLTWLFLEQLGRLL